MSLESKVMHKTLNKICSFFDLGESTGFSRAPGDANANYFVQTPSGRYLIKIIQEQHSEEDKKIEQQYLERLEEHNFPTASYLSNPQGKIVYQKDEVMAMTQKEISSTPVDQVNPELAKQMGTTLAQLHQIPFTDLPPKNHWLEPNYLPQSLALAQREFPQLPELKELERVFHSLSFSPNNFPQSIVHGDLYSSNALFQKDKLLAFIDWEEVGQGSRLLDFCTTLSELCWEEGSFNKEVYLAFYEGYRKVICFTEEEKEHLNGAFLYGALTRTIWRFLHTNYYYPDEKKKNRYCLFWELGLNNQKLPEISN